MPTTEIARIKINAGKVSGNNFRFLPGRSGRNAADKQTLFRSFSYVRVINEDDANSLASLGAVVGPSKEVTTQVPGEPESVFVEKYSKIVPLAKVTTLADAVPIRDYVTPQDQNKPKEKQLVKKFIDWASFQQLGADDVRLVKFRGNRTVNIEIWSGLFEPLTEEMYQLAGAILHGSVAYSGGKRVVKAKKTIIDPTKPADTQAVARNMAKLIQQEHGEILGGVPLWTINTWEIEHSPRDSEMVLVRHFGDYYLVEVQKGEEVVITKYTGKETEKWSKRFMRMLGEQMQEKQERAIIDAAVAAA